MKRAIGYIVAGVAGFFVLKFVFGAIWTVIKVGLAVAAVGGVVLYVRRKRQAAVGGTGPGPRLGR